MPNHARALKPIVCGIWFGKNKPNMNVFLKPFVTYMQKLSNDGVQCNINNEDRNIKVYTLCCCVDSQARPTMQGFVQYNAYYGCCWCLHPGFYVTFNRGGCVKYVLLDDVPPRRTELETVLHMQRTLTSPHPVYGVKHPSELLGLPGFNIIDGVVPDCMHLLNLGLAEQFLNYWLESGH